MTRYTVVWDEDLDRVFMNTWVASDSPTRAILTEVSNWVDRNLSWEPESKAQSELDGVFIVVVPISAVRIAVSYEVFADDRIVRVIRFNFKR